MGYNFVLYSFCFLFVLLKSYNILKNPQAYVLFFILFIYLILNIYMNECKDFVRFKRFSTKTLFSTVIGNIIVDMLQISHEIETFSLEF